MGSKVIDKVTELRAELAKLRAGTVPEDDIYDVIHKFGHEGYLEAKSDIEMFLKHPDAQLRYIALNVLTFHWMCSEHRETCEDFFRHDSDSDNRRMGVAGLGALLKGTRDSKALRLLLQTFHDPTEEKLIRDAAYSSILYILGKPASEQPSAARKLDRNDVNWNWIKEAEEIAKSPRSKS